MHTCTCTCNEYQYHHDNGSRPFNNLSLPVQPIWSTIAKSEIVIMAEDESKDQPQLGDFDSEDGFKYHRMTGKSSMFQKAWNLVKVPFTVMQLILMVLIVLVVVLQIVQLTMNQQPKSACKVSSQLNQIMTNQQSLDAQQNDSQLLQLLYNVTVTSALRLSGIVHSLSFLESSSSSTKGAVDDILLVAEELLKLQNKSLIFSSHVPVSCQDIKKFDPATPSGFYHINSALVYCEMEELCGSSDGWTRIGFMDMSDSTQDCPDGFRLYEGQGIRACGRHWGGPSCASTKLKPNGITYSEVCGRVIGYQKGTPDAVDTRFIDPSIHNDIEQYYVDGVSITHGSPRQHIWTLMAGVFQSYDDSGNCPCNTPPGADQSVQSFIGNDYFCESGNPNSEYSKGVYSVDPLWDGKGCGQLELSCCDDSIGLPWFHKKINATSDDIELRECGDQKVGDEDVLVNFYDIYVK